MLVWCDLHVARNVLCTAISRAVVINTRDFTKKLGTSQKNTRVLHSRVSSLNRAVPYMTYAGIQHASVLCMYVCVQ